MCDNKQIVIEGPDQILYQWDTGQRLRLHGYEPGTRVDFARCNQNKAASVYAYAEGGEVFCDIPDAILMEPNHIRGFVYVIDGGRGETVRNFLLPVIPRPKPEDYVEPEEVPTWHELEQRIKKIEDEGVPDEKIERAVEDYLEENPIEAPKPDLTGVVKSVNGKTPDENGNVEITIPDSSQHGGFVAQPEPPDDKSLLWIDTDDETSDEPETEPGGYYTPTVSQPDANTMEVSFAASAEGMPSVEPVQVVLPAGPRGEQGPEGPQGEQGETGARGPAGETGPAGKTPVRGVDYWTDADKQEIAEMAAELVEVPEGGGNSGDGGSGVSDVVLVDMTVAEDSDVIDIPVTAEMANIFNSCPELWFECEFRMPAADSANANGNVTISENAGSWDSIVYFKDLGLIPSNNASYNNPSRLLGIVYQTSQELMALYTLNAKNSTTKGGTQYWSRQMSVAGRHVRFKGTHAIGAGTILKIIAKGVSA